MGIMMIYATAHDAELIRQWINDDPDVAWIVKVAEKAGICQWKVVSAIEVLEEQSYKLWHVRSGSLNIPSGNSGVPDEIVSDPFVGWTEKVAREGATYPWFGGNMPGPYFFAYNESGREAPGSLARSDFSWDEDRYKAIGKPAHPEAKRWWNKLKRFVQANSFQIQWAEITNGKSPNAYVFPDAKAQLDRGRHRDINR
jgi:hypothetical protein